MSLGFSELPEETRVKLSEKGEKELWHRINEFGGIKNFSEAFQYPSSKLYNWKNKNSYIPIEIIRKVFGTEAADEVKAYKGKGRSKPVKNPVIPLPENQELLTRINSSVNLSHGTPIYQVNDRGLIQRFEQLLNFYGDVPYKIYNRDSVYELRYPKYLHQILQKMSYQEDFETLVDETAVIENGRIKLENREIKIEEFEGKLYSRKKALKLALEKEDETKVRQLIMEEAEKVRQTFNQ